MSRFQYDPAILTRYPTIIGGVILARDIGNGPTPEGLRERYQQEQQATLARLGNTPLSQIESLNAWRKAFRGFGVDPTQYRSAAEALLRRLTKKGDIPSVNMLVDLGNLVSIRYALPVAVIDSREISGGITVHFASGEERYTTLGQSAEGRPEPGEVVFTDQTGLVYARRWCWRQSEQSAAQPDTTQAIITIEGHHAQARQDIQAALEDLQELLGTYTQGNWQAGILDATHPAISNAHA